MTQTPREPQSAVVLLFGALVIVLCALAIGCSSIDKLPAGTQLQSSTFGVKIAPQAVDGVPLTLGSHTTIITTAQPSAAGPNLNRFDGRAPGVNVRSTVASGAVGEQLGKLAGSEAALEALVRDPDASPAEVQP